MKLSKKIFLILIFLIPLNLGKHFEILGSYVWGVLSDYLIPVVYVQDLLIFLILIFWFFEKMPFSFTHFKKFLNRESVPAVFLFIFSLFFSVLSSSRMFATFTVFLRIFLYTLFYFYIMSEVSLEKDGSLIIKALSVNTIFLGLLAAAQFIKQGSVFNNYLFLGEQPYSSAAWNVAKESIFGTTKIPSYGLFRHPNVFGGYLAIVLVWIFSKFKQGLLYKAAFILGGVSLILTFSYTAWTAFLLGIAGYVYIVKYKKVDYLVKKQNCAVIFLLLFLVINSLSPFFGNFKETSFSRRGDLVKASLLMIEKNPLFGVGPGSFSANSVNFMFMQPVHNIYLLAFSEGGVFSFLFFASIFIMAFFTQLRSRDQETSALLLIPLLQIMLIGSLDHYFWTIHQTQIMYWLVLGLSLSKNISQANASQITKV